MAADYVPATLTDDLKKTPLYASHVARGARLVPYAGFAMPVQFEGLVAEHKAVRERAGLFDVCHMGELEMRGEYAEAVVNYLVTNDVKKLEDGKALYTACCNAGGTILDDLIVYRRAWDRFLIVCNASNHEKIAAHFSKAADHHCEFEDLTDRTGLLALQGPLAAMVLRQAGASEETLSLKAFHFAGDTLAGIPVTVARTGYTGEDGFEIFCPWESAEALAEYLLDVGEADGLVPAGLGARDTLRLEARLSLYGNEIDETTNPLEAGLGWVVKFDKGDFVGREALVAAKEKGLTRKLVGLVVTGRGIARHGYPIVDDSGAEIGVVTSGSPGPTVGKNIALAYVPTALAALGTNVLVKIRDQSVAAEVVKTPFYARPKEG